jgi:sugar lactone lactonase YvrE
MVSPSGTIRTIAGTGVNGSSGDGGPATSAQLSYPNAVAVDGSGNIFISDEGASTVRKVSPGGTITTIAGVVYPSTAVCGDGGPAPSSSIGDPSGLAVDKQGNLYIATDYAVCKVTPSGTITRIAGTGKAGYFSGDGGPATSATFTARGVAVDVRGSVYITDYSTTPKIPPSSYPSFHVRKVSPSGIISTIAGSGKALAVGGKYKQVNGDGGPATSALLFSPHGIAVDAHGNVYITDSQRVRKIGA